MDITLKGLVIGETKLGDNKKYIRVLTGEYGRISVIAHGASSIKSRHFAAVRLFTYSSFVLTKRRESYTLREAALIKSFFSLAHDAKSLALASYIVSVAEYVAAEGEDMGALMSLTLNSLYVLAESDKPRDIIKAAFELKCASVIGFAPALVACSHCGADISHEDVYMRVNAGDVVCEKCKDKLPPDEHELFAPLSPALTSALRYIEYSDIKKIFSFSLPSEEARRLGDVCESYLCAHIETDFPALAVYDSL